jgi:hypothetical protein
MRKEQEEYGKKICEAEKAGERRQRRKMRQMTEETDETGDR